METLKFSKNEKNDFIEFINDIDNSISTGSEKEYINKRLAELNKSGSAENFGILYSKIINGFIKSESKIQRSPMVDPFHLDDREIYDQLFASIKKFKETEGWKDKKLNSIIIPVIQYTITSYFGNSIGSSDIEQKNQKLYMNLSDSESQDISIKQLKGKGIAVCAEKASSAENLLSFVGINSFLIMGNCRYDDKKGESHAFNILHTTKGYFIYDPTNPRMIIERDTKNLQNTFPALYKISEDEFLNLKNGNEVAVQHENQYINNDGTSEMESHVRFYAGYKN